MTNPPDIGRGLTVFGVAFAAIAALYLGLLGLATRGQAFFADGYDGIGFVLALTDFDLSRFAPQPPGFPLFVLLSRGLHALLGVRPALAVALVSALLLPAGIAAITAVLAAQLGLYAAALFALLVAPNTLVFGLGVATLSDGAGLGAALIALSLAAWALRQPTRLACGFSGLACGLALGVRPHVVTPLVLGLLLLGGLLARRGQAPLRPLLGIGLSAGLGTLLWLLPLLSIVGASRFLSLCLAHARGHLGDFGGGLLVRTPTPLPRLGLPQLQALLAAVGPAIAALCLITPVLFFRSRSRLPQSLRLLGAALLAITLVYVVYVALLARVLGNGRHLLPVPVGLALAIVPLYAVGLRRGAARTGLLAVVALLAPFSTRQVYAFRQAPSPGAQLVAGLPDCSARLYGAAAARFYDLRCGVGAAQPAIYLGEVLSDLERRSNPPSEVLVTSEVIASPGSRARLRPIARACVAADVPASLRFFGAPHLPPRAAGSPSPSSPPSSAEADCAQLLAYRVMP